MLKVLGIIDPHTLFTYYLSW